MVKAIDDGDTCGRQPPVLGCYLIPDCIGHIPLAQLQRKTKTLVNAFFPKLILRKGFAGKFANFHPSPEKVIIAKANILAQEPPLLSISVNEGSTQV